MAGEGTELHPLDREKGALNGTIQVLTTSTITTPGWWSGTIRNPGATGAYFFWYVSDAPGEPAGTVEFSVEARDPFGGWHDLYVPTAVSTVGYRLYLMYPASDGAGGPIVEASSALTDSSEMPLPRYFRIGLTVSQSENYTVRVGMMYVP